MEKRISVYFPAGMLVVPRTFDTFRIFIRSTVPPVMIVCHPLSLPAPAEWISILVNVTVMAEMLLSYG